METDIPGWSQSAYEVEIDGIAYGRTDSSASVLAGWPGASARPGVSIRSGYGCGAPRAARHRGVSTLSEAVSAAWAASASS